MMLSGETTSKFGESQKQPMEVEKSTVTTIHQCLTENVEHLCILDVFAKLSHSNTYDIGGTYDTDSNRQLWFYFTTTVFPGYNYLMNLFVVSKNTTYFSISVANNNDITQSTNPEDLMGRSYLQRRFKMCSIKSVQPDEHFYIHTFSFSQANLTTIGKNMLYIPISIKISTKPIVNRDIIKRIKLEHDFGHLLFNKEDTDFVLESASGKQYHTHKIILAAHSPILRNMLKNQKTPSMFLDISDDNMELLLEFLYTGTMKDILKQDYLKILNLAEKFELQCLRLLMISVISEQINEANAVEIAILADRYKMEALKAQAFRFIRDNPVVMKCEAWNKLTDANLLKNLIAYLQLQN